MTLRTDDLATIVAAFSEALTQVSDENRDNLSEACGVPPGTPDANSARRSLPEVLASFYRHETVGALSPADYLAWLLSAERNSTKLPGDASNNLKKRYACHG